MQKNQSKNCENIRISIASPGEAMEILNIYAPYITNTAITFEYTVPTVTQFKQRMQQVLSHFPYIVARMGTDKIAGYAYASPFHERAAYQWSVETSIYVAGDFHGFGIGRALHTALENILKEQNIRNMNACIAYPKVPDPYLNDDSVRFHRHMGYRIVGQFYQCGYKFDRWYDMVWMEKHIGNHPRHPDMVRPFDDVRTLIKEKYHIE